MKLKKKLNKKKFELKIIINKFWFVGIANVATVFLLNDTSS